MTAELLRIAGGKERMAAALPESDRDLVEALHGRKAEILEQNLTEHGIRPRPGVVRLIGEADAEAGGWRSPPPHRSGRFAACWPTRSGRSWRRSS